MNEYLSISEAGAHIDAESSDISSRAAFGRNVFISAKRLTIGPGTVIGHNVRIGGLDLHLGEGAKIQDDVSIAAENFSLGFRSVVETRCVISGMGSPAAKSITVGDNSIIGGDCRILLPVMKVGDYVRINNHTLINGRNSCAIP